MSVELAELAARVSYHFIVGATAIFIVVAAVIIIAATIFIVGSTTISIV